MTLLEKDAGKRWQEREPLDHLDGPRADGPPPSLRAYEEFVYFQPSVQRFLYGPPRNEAGNGDAARPIRFFARSDIKALDVEIHNGLRRCNQRLRLKVDHCNLYLFDTGNVLLATELSLDPVLMAILADFGTMPANLSIAVHQPSAVAGQGCRPVRSMMGGGQKSRRRPLPTRPHLA